MYGLHPFFELLSDAISSATPAGLELDVLRRLYGLDGDGPEDIWQIAADYYLPVDRVRLIEAQGLHWVRDVAQRHYWLGDSHPCTSLWRFVRAPDGDSSTHTHVAHLMDEIGEDWLPASVLRRLLVGLLDPHVYLGHWSPELARARQPQVQERARWQFERVQAVIDRYIIWPPRVQIYPEDFRFVRHRNVCRTSGRLNGFWSVKLGRFVGCESNLEARFYYCGLECSDQVRWYQEQPLAIPYDAGNGRIAHYYPDVAFGLDDGRIVIVEIKPFRRMALAENLRKWAALRRHCAEHGYGLLVTDGREGIQFYTRRPVSDWIDSAVVSCIRRKGVMTDADLRRLCGRRGVMKDVLSIILKRRLVWTYQPFEVRAGVASRLEPAPYPNKGRLGLPRRRAW